MNDIQKPFIELSNWLKEFPENISKDDLAAKLDQATSVSQQKNGWFTRENIGLALNGISFMLEEDSMKNWLSNYKIGDGSKPKKVGLIMAGNIPLVGFHDLVCVLASGNEAIVKMSSDDKDLLPVILEFLERAEPKMKNRVKFVDRLTEFDAVIATGSNNSARYFEYYFKNVPNIIRKNRNSLAVLMGNESEEELKNLGKDVFQYFGLGCRNVSKLMLQEGYDLDKFFSAMHRYGDIINHHKYANNYDYYKAFYILNKADLLENGFLMLKQDASMYSPVSMLFYDYYSSKEDLEKQLKAQSDQIQCVVASQTFLPEAIPFGKTQSPSLFDYADGVDVMKFLETL